MDIENDDDLYGDLGDVKPAAATRTVDTKKRCGAVPMTANDRLTTSNHQLHHHPFSTGAPTSLDARVKALEMEVAALRQENETLKRNMGILYRTAKAEIERLNSNNEGNLK